MSDPDRIKVRRAPSRGHYEKSVIHKILDSHFLCHIAFVEQGYPVVIPTLYGRDGDRIYIHGATTSRLIKTLEDGIEVSACVTRLDGIVLARSAFNHSMNYHSIVLFGKADKINDKKRKLKALKVISDHIIPGRWEEVRKPNEKELKSTTVLSLPVDEASAKIRQGPPIDEPRDYHIKVWAGEIPLNLRAGDPLPDPKLNKDQLPSEAVLKIVESFRK